MTLSRKIFIPIVLLILIVLGIPGFLLYQLKIQEKYFLENTERIERLASLSQGLADEQEKADFYLLSYRFSQNPAYLAFIDKAISDKSKILDEMYPLLPSEEGKLLARSYNDARVNLDLLRKDLIGAVNKKDEEKISIYFARWNIQTENVRAIIVDLSTFNIHSIEKNVSLVQELRNQIFFMTFRFLIIIISAIFILYWYLRKSIIEPLSTLTRSVLRINRDHFFTTSGNEYLAKRKDEIGVLAKAFINMAGKLKNSYSILEEKVKERTSELQNAKKFLDSVIENLPVMLFLKDAKDLKFVRFNKAGEKLIGHTREELLGKNDYDFFPKKQAEFFIQKDREVLMGKKIVDIPEEIIQTKNQGERILHTKKVPLKDGHGRVAFLLGISDDITEQKDAELKVAEVKAKDEAVLASIGDGVAIADENGKLIFLNQVGQDILGGIANDNTSNTWQSAYGVFDAITLAPYPAEQMPLLRAVKGQAVSKVSLLIKNAKNPEGIVIAVTATPIFLGGKSAGAVAIFRDMTKEKEIDKAKSEFVSLASHQLRTPLTSIGWYTEMLLAQDIGKLNKDQKKYLDEIYQGNRRMVHLVNDILSASHLELGTFVVERKPTDVEKVLKEAVAEEQPGVLKKKLHLSVAVSKHIPPLLIDPKLLRMILQNLLSNAVKYTPEKGKVSVLLSLEKKSQIAIEVSDTGYGIPKKEQDKVFSKLFRAHNITDKETEGTGLGLYIVKSVVDQCGGEIHFESKENKGTTFFVTLPVSVVKKKE